MVADNDGDLPLHLATQHGHEAVVGLLLQAAPQATMVAGSWGRLPLHLAAEEGHTALVAVLLEAGPAAAMTGCNSGLLPLHVTGDAAVGQLLLQAAPAAALTQAAGCGSLPLHRAAEGGHAGMVELLLQAAPGSATARDSEGDTPLIWALTGWPGCTAAARRLAAAMPAHAALAALATAGTLALPLLADCVAAHLPLSDAQWALVPAPCPGLGRALPAALECSAAQAAQVARRLPAADARRLRTFALCLARVQRRTRVALPAEVAGRLVALFASP